MSFPMPRKSYIIRQDAGYSCWAVEIYKRSEVEHLLKEEDLEEVAYSITGWHGYSRGLFYALPPEVRVYKRNVMVLQFRATDC